MYYDKYLKYKKKYLQIKLLQLKIQIQNGGGYIWIYKDTPTRDEIKIIVAKNMDILSANLKSINSKIEIKNNEKIDINLKFLKILNSNMLLLIQYKNLNYLKNLLSTIMIYQNFPDIFIHILHLL